jgi:preprotein translocase subunit SecF
MKFPISIIPVTTNFNFIGLRKLFFLLSIILTISTVVLLFNNGLNKGIDFTGGLIIEAKTSAKLDLKVLRHSIIDAGYEGASLQEMSDENTVMIRLQPKNASPDEDISIVKLLLSDIDSAVSFRRVDYVGPKVGSELMQKGVNAMLLSLVAMMIYIWSRFSWQFGVGAIIALFHDSIITLGFYSLTRFEFDLSSIAAILTIVGYSINDTVVIYDRIRDNLTKHKKMKTTEILNLSINETLSRTIMTVLTTAVVCIALVIFGGDAIRGFSSAVLFGILFGTYSSICISAPILLYTRIK